MNVDWLPRRQGQNPGEIGGGGGAQRMRGDAGARVIGQGFRALPHRLQQAGVGIDISAEPALASGQGRRPRAAIGVKHGQMGQADAGLRRRLKNPLRHLGGVGIGGASRLMVEIVKLAHRGKARLLHLHIDQCRDGLHLVRGQVVEEAIHQLAPGPEAVAPGEALFGHPGHGALEGMAVQVGQGRQQGGDPRVARQRCRVGGDAGDFTASDGNPDPFRPPRRQQRVVGENHRGGLLMCRHNDDNRLEPVRQPLCWSANCPRFSANAARRPCRAAMG